MKDIRAETKENLQIFFESLGEKKFRAQQVWEWLWKKCVTTFDDMTNLPVSLRQKLENEYEIIPLKVEKIQASTDGTLKFIFRLFDDHFIEGVLIPTPTRMTACVSSQVGCSLQCKFCATGYMDRKRNLTQGEIFDQIVWIRNKALTEYQKPLTNIVFMGMGEPLLNFKNVTSAIEKITAQDGLRIAPKRITVSTVGIVKKIKELADKPIKYNLAISLHGAMDKTRSSIMPINESNNLEDLKEVLQYFYIQTRNPITLEYILLKGINDSQEDAEQLALFAKKIPKTKINIIEYNPISEASFSKPKLLEIQHFEQLLRKAQIATSIRRSRGKDIDAACGQLALKEQSKSSYA